MHAGESQPDFPRSGVQFPPGPPSLFFLFDTGRSGRIEFPRQIRSKAENDVGCSCFQTKQVWSNNFQNLERPGTRNHQLPVLAIRLCSVGRFTKVRCSFHPFLFGHLYFQLKSPVVICIHLRLSFDLRFRSPVTQIAFTAHEASQPSGFNRLQRMTRRCSILAPQTGGPIPPGSPPFATQDSLTG